MYSSIYFWEGGVAFLALFFVCLVFFVPLDLSHLETQYWLYYSQILTVGRPRYETCRGPRKGSHRGFYLCESKNIEKMSVQSWG